jgi:hypothetical protein
MSLASLVYFEFSISFKAAKATKVIKSSLHFLSSIDLLIRENNCC